MTIGIVFLCSWYFVKTLEFVMWQSNAEYGPEHGFDNNTTTDTHQTREQAEGVCRLLQREGLGGERIHFPIHTWVSKVDDRRTPSAGCWHITQDYSNSDPHHCRKPCIPGTLYCADHQQ